MALQVQKEVSSDRVFRAQPNYFTDIFIEYVSSKLSKSRITGFYYIEEVKFLIRDLLSLKVTFIDYNRFNHLVEDGYLWIDLPNKENENDHSNVTSKEN